VLILFKHGVHLITASFPSGACFLKIAPIFFKDFLVFFEPSTLFNFIEWCGSGYGKLEFTSDLIEAMSLMPDALETYDFFSEI